MLLISIAFVLTCSLFTSAEFSVSVPAPSVSAQMGMSIVLPCKVSLSLNDKLFEVRWYKNDAYDSPVLLYKDLEVQENVGASQYKNRVSLVGELEKGNISLKLDNLTLADRGEYVCLVKSFEWYDKASMTLNIIVIGSHPLISLADAVDQVNVTCVSDGWSPKPSLTWRDKGGSELTNSHSRYKRDSEGLVSVMSWVLLSPSGSDWISCSVGLSDQEMRESRVLPLKGFWREAFISALFLSLIVIITLTVLLLLVRQGLLPHCSSRKNAKLAGYGDILAGLMSQSSAPPVSNEEIIRKWKKLKKSKVNLTLDPETLQKPLIVTRDRNGVYRGQLTKEGLGLTFPHVLGKEELSSGQQYWEVTVDKNAKCKRSWRVGVTQKPASEGVIRALCYEERYGIYASTDRHTLIPNEGHCTMLGMLLDFKDHTLSFYNIDKQSHLYTFTMNNTNNIKYFALVSPGIKDQYPVYLNKK
ncbi:butyrophilin subfamily 1 member A1-like [Electrophorus electricus]|uniref:butyrophilin subfamily 1 member A1-like n=1 Tax=Electrophorus electricus TaxID=8005 RepID=UPI0015D02CD8|nr:butyrophilin subfamily 1 member A1-like [Electrophorus electricus]